MDNFFLLFSLKSWYSSIVLIERIVENFYIFLKYSNPSCTVFKMRQKLKFPLWLEFQFEAKGMMYLGFFYCVIRFSIMNVRFPTWAYSFKFDNSQWNNPRVVGKCSPLIFYTKCMCTCGFSIIMVPCIVEKKLETH